MPSATPAPDPTANENIYYATKIVSPAQEYGQNGAPYYGLWVQGVAQTSAIRTEVFQGSGNAIFASSDQDVAAMVLSKGNTAVTATTTTTVATCAAVIANSSESAPGVRAISNTGAGVIAVSNTWDGVDGTNGPGCGFKPTAGWGAGVRGDSSSGYGVIGTSAYGIGVHGECIGNYAAVEAINHGAGPGVQASSVSGNGVVAASSSANGVVGTNGAGCGFQVNPGWGAGVRGDTDNGYGALVTSHTGVGLHAECNGNGSAIVAINRAAGPAGQFQGNVSITGDLTVTKDVILTGADCAEEFDIAPGSQAEPGTVMVLDAVGELTPSSSCYDKRVVGIVSGAGDFRPALTLDRRAEARNPRSPIALLGKVFCKVDTNGGPIEVGDLLTTSSTPGHAMRASDPLRAFGAVIGKALAPLASGSGTLPVIVALQ